MLPQYDEGVAVIMSDLAGCSASISQQYPTTPLGLPLHIICGVFATQSSDLG